MSSRHLVWVVLLTVAACILIAGCTTQPPGQNNTSTPTPAPTATATPAGTPAGNVTDLTNQNSPEVANFTTYPSTTRLHAPVSIGLRRVVGNFTAPLFVANADDGSGRLFVVDQTGYVKVAYLNGTVVDRPFLDVRDRMIRLDPTYDERGLLSIAFHPNFSENRRVYAYYSAPLRAGADRNWSCTNHLSEFTVNATDPNRVDNATERVLLEVDKPYQNHNGGILLFGPDDGYLYLTLGDGGRADDTGMGHIPGTGNAQNLTTMHGKVIRLDVNTNTTGKQYGIPADNPFQSNASYPPEIYAYGFRNPAFATFDSGGSHRMFIAMAGQRLFESVLILYRGGAYPWNIREGTHCFDPSNNFQVPNTSCRISSYYGQSLIGPIVELGHDVGDTIVGGVVYRGSTLSAVPQGAYIFGTWSDESRIAGNGTLLVAVPPAGLDTATLPGNAADLTAAQNAMWTTSELRVANNANGRINAFVRGMYETADHEVLLLINQNGGPGLTPQNSGEVWLMVPANTTGLVNTSAQNVTPTPTGTTGSGTAVALSVTIMGDTFTPKNLSVPAGARVTLTFDDQDVNPHNFAVYPSLTSSDAVFRSPLVTGPVVATYTFTAPSTPGTYYYRSDPNSGAVGTMTVTGAGGAAGTTAPGATVTEYMEQDSGVQTFATSPPVITTATTGTISTTATTAVPNTTAATPVPTTMVTTTLPTATTTPATTATAAPTVTTVPPTTVVTTGATTPGAVTIPLAAQNLAFSASTITAPAGAQVTVTFNNQDAGVPHNVAFYTDASAATAVFKGPLVTGPATTTYTFTAPSTPGTYFFRCDVHPTTMTGSFVVT